jgi:hypothetical protein
MHKIAPLLLTAFIAGCSGVPYAPKGSSGYMGGYSDKKLADGKYLVLFEGNGYNKMPQVVDFVKQRAAELCAPQSFDIQVRPYLTYTTSTGYAGGSVYISNHAFPTAEGTVTCKEAK